jgi:hypothetical protein
MGQMTGILPWMMLLVVLGALSLAGISLWLTYQLQIRLMRISSERLGIPAINMEPRPEPKEYTPKPDARARIHVPIPGGAMFKPTEPRKIG